MNNGYTLKHYFHAEIAGGINKPFSWLRVLRRAWKNRQCNYLFWFRIANELNGRNRFLKSLAKWINRRLMRNYSVEIMLGVKIGPGLIIPHPQGIVITKHCIIGDNFLIRQGCTIGVDFKNEDKIIIGDNVDVGANSTIIGSGIEIGDGVRIGAMTFVNKSVPPNVICINKKPMCFKSIL